MAVLTREQILATVRSPGEPSYQDCVDGNVGPDYCQCSTCRMWYPSIVRGCPSCECAAKLRDLLGDLDAPIKVYLRANYGYCDNSIWTGEHAFVFDVLLTEFGLVRSESGDLPIKYISYLLLIAHNYEIDSCDRDGDFQLNLISNYMENLSKSPHDWAKSIKGALLFKFSTLDKSLPIPAASPSPPGTDLASDFRPDLVTLKQAAAMCHRNKRTLESCKTKGTLPTPAVEGGGGRPDLYDWKVIGPWLEATFGIKQPLRFPGNLRS